MNRILYTFLAVVLPLTAMAQPFPALLSSIVKINATVSEDARTASGLGTEREGNGVLIDDDGLIVTIGYLILEASAVKVEFAGGVVKTAEDSGLRPRYRFRADQNAAAARRGLAGSRTFRRPSSRASKCWWRGSADRTKRWERSSWIGASSPDTGNICSRTRSSFRLPTRGSAARLSSTARANSSASARSSFPTPSNGTTGSCPATCSFRSTR